MSIFSDFASSAMNQARDIIGTSLFSIGSGYAIEAVQAEQRLSRDSDLGGFDERDSLDIVCKTDEFVSHYADSVKSYLGKNCTYNYESWRIGDIEKGESFVTISLISRKQQG